MKTTAMWARARVYRFFKGRVWALVMVGVLVIGGGVYLWEEHIEDRVIPKRWGVVEPGKIYRSGQLSASLVRETLEEKGIKVIISLTERVSSDARREVEVARELGIERIDLPLNGDGTGLLLHYAKAIQRMVTAIEEGKAVLVHCSAGTQRAGGVVAAYRVLVQGKEPRLAYEEMQQYDWDPDRDVAVLNYVNSNMGALAQMLVEMEVIDRVPNPLPALGPG
jgi:protein tyrosine/serine phosphatase